jgi:hypothetical protein
MWKKKMFEGKKINDEKMLLEFEKWIKIQEQKSQMIDLGNSEMFF